MNRLSKAEFAIFSSFMWSLLPKDLTNQNLFTYLLTLLRNKGLLMKPLNMSPLSEEVHSSIDFCFVKK